MTFTTMPSKSLFTPYEVAYRIVQCKKSLATGENLILATANDSVKQLSHILLPKNKGMIAYKKCSRQNKFHMFWDVFLVVLWLLQFCQLYRTFILIHSCTAYLKYFIYRDSLSTSFLNLGIRNTKNWLNLNFYSVSCRDYNGNKCLKK